ncbi:MAG: IS1595 family transposase [Deltaproteobacteria bacterium]|jgi:transposase-like protein|nr:IS1595 family transposase [Deltaproteobacteria bacterium]
MVWFRAMWFMVGQKFGTNAMGPHRTLGISYETAWAILHKLRRAMVRPGRERLCGTVDVDEAYVGGVSEDSPGRKADQKALVVLGVEVKGKSLGRARMRVVNSATAENLTGFVKEHVEPGNTVITDGWKSYARLKDDGYIHKIGKAIGGQDALPHVHRVYHY